MRRLGNKLQDTSSSTWASLMLLCFGLGVLAFLVTIERVNWFQIKPASGTAAAMAKAAQPATASNATTPASDAGLGNAR